MKRPIGTLALLACIFLMLPAMAAAGSDMDRLDRDRLAIGRALLEMQADDWPVLLQHYTGDIEYHDPIVDINGIDMMSQFLARLFASSPDLVTTIEDEICIGDVYAASWTMYGSFDGVPYNAKGATLIKFLPGGTQVFYQRDYYTEGDIMASIPGLDEAIGAFRTYYRCAVDPTYVCPLEPAGNALSDGPTGGVFPKSAKPTLPEMAEPRSDRSRINRERMEIGRALVEIDSANWPTLLPYYAEDIEYNDPIVTIEGIGTMAQFLARLFGSSPDLITTVEDEICIGGVYAATWTMVGAFNGVPYSAAGMSIVKFRPGETRVYYSRDYYTEGDIMINIPGLDEPAEAFRIYYRCAVDPTFDCPLEPPAETAARGESADAEGGPNKATFGLEQNAPNPFNPMTTISYRVPPEGGMVTLRIYDVHGRVVRTLVEGHEPSGVRSARWDGRDEQGRPVASGVYYYMMTAPDFSERKKMVLLR